MRVSVKWLRELVAIGEMPVDKIAHALTMAGLEVEEITPVAAEFSGIVVGHVKSVAPHPNADKLRVTTVDAGTGEILTIVCGAPNVAEGQKVPCAVVGAKLPGLDMVGWFAIVAPTGTPAAAIDRVNQDVNALLNDREVADRIAVIGPIVDGSMNVDAVGRDFRLYPIPNCGKRQPMQTKRLGNGGPTMRSRARLTGGS